MRSASQSAMALARGEPVSPAPSRIAEIDDLSTGLRLAAETLESRNRERDEASRLKDEFLMTVSHELRTPLTAIYGWARMLSTGQIRDAQRPRAIDAIERNAGALQQLVNDLLDVSRIVSGKLRLDVAAVSLPDVVGAAIDAIRPAAARQEHRGGDDGRRLERSVGVRRRRPPAAGGVEPAVQRRPVHAVGGRIEVVTVARAGGRHRDRRARHAAPASTRSSCRTRSSAFARAASGTTRAHGGLGLGLAIVRHLVELHGGTVEASKQHAGAGRDVSHRAAGASGDAHCSRSRPAAGRGPRRRRRAATRASTASASWSPTTT